MTPGTGLIGLPLYSLNDLSIRFYYGGPSTDETECVPPPGPHSDRRLGQERKKLSAKVVRTVK
jgi:hypothetical protein